ncbi:MAG: hypothetical protein ACK559_26250, partial [bacterium]
MLRLALVHALDRRGAPGVHEPLRADPEERAGDQRPDDELAPVRVRRLRLGRGGRRLGRHHEPDHEPDGQPDRRADRVHPGDELRGTAVARHD